MQKDTKTALIFGGLAVSVLVIFVIVRNNNLVSVVPENAGVSIENGTQIINLAAKGGFSPSSIVATAGLPTELRVATNGTYDCSSIIVIPELGYQQTLQPTGIETIRLSADQAQGTLEGTCGMGMYDFEIAFM